MRTPTPEGEEIAQRLIEERRASLARLCEGWSPDQNADLAGLLTRLARELAADPPRRGALPRLSYSRSPIGRFAASRGGIGRSRGGARRPG